MDPTSIQLKRGNPFGKGIVVLRWVLGRGQRHDIAWVAKPTPGDSTLTLKPTLGAYVTCNEDFKRELLELKNAVLAYAQKRHPRRTFNILLASTPGNGKSFLVKQLAIELGTAADFSEYYVSSFRDRSDLVAILDRVRNQAERGSLPVVLLDEVDSSVEGKQLYQDLLAPMWDGKYYVGHAKRDLARAVFFFAASDALLAPSIENVIGLLGQETPYGLFSEIWRRRAEAQARKKRVPKLRDFMDRMDLLLCIPPLDPLIRGSDVASEAAQIASTLVQKYYPDIKRMEKSAAWSVIRLISQADSFRAAESAVFRSQEPAGEEFKFEYLPPSLRELHDDAETHELHNHYFILEDA